MAPSLGGLYAGDGRCSFRVWAPLAKRVAVSVYSPVRTTAELSRDADGYWSGQVGNLGVGARYKFCLDNEQVFPDPASRSQPEGVHEASEIVSDEFDWTDSGWHGIPVEQYIIYELHVGAFTPAGTLDSAIEFLTYLRKLGVTAIELMPVAQFPGSRNWGYDGVYPFAVQNSYGGASALKRLVNAAHEIGLAVLLDVVYNHLGPEGNYLSHFGPYFTDRYATPWGQAINFDGPDSRPVRDYFIQNALYWIRDFHIDGLRLDAVHAIHDSSTPHILTEIAAALHKFANEHERTVAVIAESDLNEAKIVRSGEAGGYGLDAQWSDDFHHSVHTVLTGESAGYYEDFGSVEDVAKALSSGFVYAGQYSKHRGRCHGTECVDIPGRSFVVGVQNHDQIGNRMTGERLSHLVPFDDLKLAAGMLLLSPFVPLLFMGQEYAETAPFLYFVSHSDPWLVEAVREGREREFASFAWRGELPDAQDESTFQRSKLNHDLRSAGRHAVLLEWYRTLLSLRARQPALMTLNRQASAVDLAGTGRTIALRRWHGPQELLAIFHLGADREELALKTPSPIWLKLLDSAEEQWLGAGSDVQARLLQGEDGILSVRLTPKQCIVLLSDAST